MAIASTAPQELLGHPKGLYVCFLTEMWERFAFYGMKALLLMYLTKYHLFTDANGYLLLGTYAGLAYALPLIGGMLADRYLGMRKAVVFGGLLLVIGQFGMGYIGQAATGTPDAAVRDALAVQIMYASLALIGVGVGFLKPNISTIVGRLYPENDPRRDSGFTIFYAGINLGAMLSSLVVGYIGFNVGWGWGFGLSGALMLVGLIQFLWGQRYLDGHAEPPDAQALRKPVLAGLSAEWLIYLGGILVTVAMWQVLQIRIDFSFLGGMFGGHEVTLTEVLAVILGIGLFIWFGWFLFSGITAQERGRMIVLMVLIVVSALFWGLYEQTYGTWVAFNDRLMSTEFFPGMMTVKDPPLPWSILSLIVIPLGFVAAMKLDAARASLGKGIIAAITVVMLVCLVHDVFIVKQNAGSLTFLGSLFVILLTPVFTALWPILDKYGINPSSPAKFGIGLIFAGLATGILMYAAKQSDGSQLISVWWLVAAYFVLELGEMVLSPIGLSAVTQLSVSRVVGLMMGAWFLFSAFGEIIAGRFGTWAAITPNPDGTFDKAKALAVYSDVFGDLMWIGVGAGVVMLALAPILARTMRAAPAHGVVASAS
ncbi:peptide MFS transporter [Tahibacter amnicola]|uniref:Peptide MFS transporter n=1 Tax=Tahibacter amnicola TaxID=2976241 RepID=A0ABY6BDF6_9GAMM|nr:peptide MFS transporter [Tahibacter amnicola]UXI67145.1 peptide MFS transporter [Tahibacter amnicola]